VNHDPASTPTGTGGAHRQALPRPRRSLRITLLDRLRDGEATVSELREATGASQQNVSKHLGVLLEAGIFDLCEQVCGGLRRQLDDLDAILQGAADR
jgi:DNA-binding transcriptional ArsR family regulator